MSIATTMEEGLPVCIYRVEREGGATTCDAEALYMTDGGMWYANYPCEQVGKMTAGTGEAGWDEHMELVEGAPWMGSEFDTLDEAVERAEEDLGDYVDCRKPWEVTDDDRCGLYWFAE